MFIHDAHSSQEKNPLLLREFFCDKSIHAYAIVQPELDLSRYLQVSACDMKKTNRGQHVQNQWVAMPKGYFCISACFLLTRPHQEGMGRYLAEQLLEGGNRSR